MKKLFAIFLVVFALGACSSSDDGNNNSNSKITPPAWIQGSWGIEVDGLPSLALGGYKFTADDACILQVGSSEHCWKENIAFNNSIPNSPKITVNQEISDSEYKLSITNMGQTLRLHFRKINSTTIRNVDNGSELIKVY